MVSGHFVDSHMTPLLLRMWGRVTSDKEHGLGQAAYQSEGGRERVKERERNRV